MSPSESLACRTGKGVRVAVIDSGVHASHPHIGGVAGGVTIGEELDAKNPLDIDWISGKGERVRLAG